MQSNEMYLLAVAGLQFLIIFWSMVKFIIKMHTSNGLYETQEKRLEMLEWLVANVYGVAEPPFQSKSASGADSPDDSDSDETEETAAEETKKAQ